MIYVDGFIASVPSDKKSDYIDHCKEAVALFKEYGALRQVENWGDDVPDGEVTDFRKAVQAKEGEIIVFSWIEWPSKEARDEAWKKMMEDPRMKNMSMPFDGKRMIYGGFQSLVDE